MIEFPKILMIGGATRNVGKTSFIYQIIKNLSEKNIIVAIKIKTIYENDNFFHGKDINPLKENEKYRITKENDISGNEDTSKMLNAGAYKVFKIKTKNKFILEALSELNTLISDDNFIICESNSLREFIIPGLFIMIKHIKSEEIKPSALKLEKFADKIIFTDGENHDFNPKNIFISENNWKIKN